MTRRTLRSRRCSHGCAENAKYNEKDSKTFTGLFHRVELYREAKMERTKAPCQSEVQMREIQNPSPEMIEDAKKHGVDLTDPMVIQKLQRFEHEGRLDAEDGDAAASSLASRSSSALPPTTPTGFPPPEVD